MGRIEGSLRHGSLFSGIGGFDLAAEWLGWENIFHCEISPFCQRVLKYYFPKADSHEDIKKTDFTKYRGKIDILTGGFPCQPYSVAGKRLGKNDDRHLWPDMLRAVREIRPAWVVAENVLGIVNWDKGVVFEEVQADLEGEGYSVQPYVLPAAGVGAPHRRERVWFIAYAQSNRDRRALSELEAKNDAKQQPEECGEDNPEPRHDGSQRHAAHSALFGRHGGRNNWQERYFQGNGRTAPEDQPGRQGRKRGTGKAGTAAGNPEHNSSPDRRLQPAGPGEEDQGWEAAGPEHAAIQDHWEDWPTQPPVCGGNDGFPGRLDNEPVFEGIPFPVKPITFPKWRIESIKAMGNAIVPQVVLQIFKVIQKMTDMHGFSGQR